MKKKKLLTKIYFLFYSRKFIFNLKKKKSIENILARFETLINHFRNTIYTIFFFFSSNF